jgi:hypothetical protein
MVYAALFGIGKFCFGQARAGIALAALAIFCAGLLYRDVASRLGASSAGNSNTGRL